ncbi:MAG TPA: RNA polymerase sigma factor [Polyangiaceae bacterium]|nr:RNA polymerase sigma factor [Polyangiaceae bacterium]
MSEKEALLLSLSDALKRGEQAVARSWLEAIAPIVLRTVRQVLGTHDPDVEDVTQEALVGSLGAIHGFRGACSVSHFVRRIALLTALNARRRNLLRQQLAPTSHAEMDEVGGPGPTPHDELQTEQRRRAFMRLLDELPATQAEVLGLHCILGLTLAEASELIAVPVNTLRGRLVSAKAALRERLALDPTARDLLMGGR